MIDKKLMKQSNMATRVSNEVQIHWQLHHRSILTLHNYFEDEKCVYLVTELCSNGELYQYIQHRNRSGNPLSEEEVRGIMKSVVEGVMFLHANGIIHRDLKLSNLLLNENFDVKIGDFGLAVKVSGAGGEQKTMCGTPNYISPEIVSRQPYGLTSDVWSLGCMLVTLLTGTPPFESEAVKTTLDRVSKGEYTLPHSISFHARDLIHQLLQKNPSQRIPINKILEHPFFDGRMKNLRPLASNIGSVGSERLSRHSKNHAESSSKHTQDRVLQKVSSEASFNNARSTSTSDIPRSSHAEQDRQRRHSFEQTSKNEILRSTQTEKQAVQHDESVPKLSTNRLKTMKQTTKHGTIEIAPNGSVVLNFKGDDYHIQISSDGENIQLYPLNSRSGTEFLSHPLQSYTRHTLPQNFEKKYRYAARFIDLVRSKTPKITFYSPQAKCMLMENSPLSDFDMNFYNGIKVHNSTTRSILEFKIPIEVHKSMCDHDSRKTKTEPEVLYSYNISALSSLQLPSHLVPIFKHVQECLRQCTEIERNSEEGIFPLILKSSNCSGDAAYGKVSSKSGSVTSQKEDDGKRDKRESLRQIGRGDDRQSVSGRSVGASSVTAVRTAVSKVTDIGEGQGMVIVGKGEGFREGINVVDWKYLGGVGWCLKGSEGKFVMLFDDGVKVCIDARRHVMEIESDGEDKR
ncbi:hypothetical protein HK098_001622 [Nowakowskiella sp. JEL0407]|nr:hypothetical protein HK098_001622 [Nowakowskiella sp. JEL0407]